MAIEQYTITFTGNMADRPIIANLSKNYKIIPILQKAQISESAGWVQVALHGERDEIQRAIADLMTLGVMVSPIHLNSLNTGDVNPMP